MIKAATTSTPSRRTMLAGTSSALLGGIAILSGQSAACEPSQDSELLVLCVQYERAEAELDKFYESTIEPDPARKAGYDLWNAALDRLHYENMAAFDLVLAHPAETIEGLAAKSKVLTVNIDRTEPTHGSEITISDKRLEMAYALAHNTMKLAKVRP